MFLENKKILLVVTGGVAAFKAIDVLRLLKKQGADVTCVLTKSAKEFVTPLSLSALSGNKIYDELFDLNDEAEMGHIELSRAADLVLVVPATANFLAKMRNGLADDLASTLMLATDKDVMVAPAMNVRMWEHDAVKENVETLKARGVLFVDPTEGEMACGEFGFGRLAEPEDIFQSVVGYFEKNEQIFAGKHMLITAGPTHEHIDPVRFIGNVSSGKQGYALANWAQKMGAKVTLISGPTMLQTPLGVERINVKSARDMLEAVENALPADIAIFAAAVADWRAAEYQEQKIKKQKGEDGASIRFVENPDILKTISNLENKRPNFVTGFAAETNNVIEHGIAKLKRKNCDMLVINDVSAASGVMGGDHNQVTIIEKNKDEQIVLDRASKDEIAKGILQVIGEKLNAKD